MRCYCSICRKTVEGGGYAINDGALSDTLEGEENLYVYNARLYDRGSADEEPASEAERTSAGCARASCGSSLRATPSPGTPLHTSTIVNPLPKPSECDHIMLDYAASWCDPAESFADWHRRHDLRDDPEDDRGSR